MRRPLHSIQNPIAHSNTQTKAQNPLQTQAKEFNCDTLLKEIKKDKAIKADVLREILRDYFKMMKAEVLGAKLPRLLALFADKVNINVAEETPNGK